MFWTTCIPAWCSFVLISLQLFLSYPTVKFLKPKGSSFTTTWIFQQLKLLYYEYQRWVDSSNTAAVSYAADEETYTLRDTWKSWIGTVHNATRSDSKPQHHLQGTMQHMQGSPTTSPSMALQGLLCWGKNSSQSSSLKYSDGFKAASVFPASLAGNIEL